MRTGSRRSARWEPLEGLSPEDRAWEVLSTCIDAYAEVLTKNNAEWITLAKSSMLAAIMEFKGVLQAPACGRGKEKKKKSRRKSS